MNYPFENLTPERFQEFCQAILAKEYPELQVFPVAQPDGGRDAISPLYVVDPGGDFRRGFIMFQVKFTRNPGPDSQAALLRTLESEIPKVISQMPKGAERYIVVSNVSGSAHPDSGGIDTLQVFLEESLGLPSRCIWREGLSRLLDGLWDIKWAFPELMTGPDLIRVLVESRLSEESERRTRTLMAFIRDQYELDAQIKFKQVDLQNSILELFIDVPLAISHSNSPKLVELFSRMYRQRRYFGVSEFESHESEEGPDLGAAAFLFSKFANTRFPKIVIEGAPGQGKSTIVQFVCQIHRIKLLDISSNTIPNDATAYLNSALMLPFKVDLRDFAAWLGGDNPFILDEEPVKGSKTLETFLAILVSHHSGGSDFGVNDLLAVCRISHILIVFDGLDEVADIKRRKEVVEEIMKGVSRLETNSPLGLNAIVTSRPAAFANSPGLPSDRFPVFQLGNVPTRLAKEYASKWVRARKLSPRDASEVKKIVEVKLHLAHVKDLARNTMQLTILLTLIYARGSSLPDKLTSLYDSYTDVFLNREAEKSEIVRNHRDLVVNIHRYLAWLMHAESEIGENGRIENARLQTLLKTFLENDGYDVSLGAMLFTGMVERVMALVSRVEGTYEFEVQPLREYFAARYLYETAPYSPTGAEKRGTKPDRFDIIARNFYWLNVARFYAGCHSKGELTSLIDRLEELFKDEKFRLTFHPRYLASILLSDWVFSQHPKSVNAVISMVLDGLGLRLLSAAGSQARRGRSKIVALPTGCGREELLDRCFSILETIPPYDYARSVIDLMQANSGAHELLPRWKNVLEGLDKSKFNDWLEYGYFLGILPKIGATDLLVQHEVCNRRVQLLFNSNQSKVLESNADLFRSVEEQILDCKLSLPPRRGQDSLLKLFCQVMTPAHYQVAFTSAPISLANIWHGELFVNYRSDIDLQADLLSTFQARAADVVKVAMELATETCREWSQNLLIWEKLVSTILLHFDERCVLSIKDPRLGPHSSLSCKPLRKSGGPLDGCTVRVQAYLRQRSKVNHRMESRAQSSNSVPSSCLGAGSPARQRIGRGSDRQSPQA